MKLSGKLDGRKVTVSSSGEPPAIYLMDAASGEEIERASLTSDTDLVAEGSTLRWGHRRISIRSHSPIEIATWVDELGRGTRNSETADPAVPSTPIPSEYGGLAAVASVVSLAVWVWAAISTYMQKSRMEDMIADSWDISAVQIQQLSGEVTAHGLTALVIAMAASVPAVVCFGAHLVNRVSRR